MTTAPLPTTPPIVAHDSATCTLGPDGGKCDMCAWVESRPGWTVHYNIISAESDRWVGTGWEFFDGETDATRCYRRQRAIGNVPSKRKYLAVDYPHLGAVHRYRSPSLRLQEVAASAIAQSAAMIRARRAALLERAAPDALTEGALALAEAWLQDELWFNELSNNAMQDAEILKLAQRLEAGIGNYLERERGLREGGR